MLIAPVKANASGNNNVVNSLKINGSEKKYRNKTYGIAITWSLIPVVGPVCSGIYTGFHDNDVMKFRVLRGLVYTGSEFGNFAILYSARYAFGGGGPSLSEQRDALNTLWLVHGISLIDAIYTVRYVKNKIENDNFLITLDPRDESKMIKLSWRF